MADNPKPSLEFTTQPAGATKCVVVLHEVWGLVEHTEDVCKRLGKLGFAATAPNLYAGHDDLLTPANIQSAMEGVWALSLDERRDRVKVAAALDANEAPEEIREATELIYDPGFRDRLLANAIRAVDEAHSKFGLISTLGFCMGGGLSLKCASRTKVLRSAVSFYGQSPTLTEVRGISTPLLDIHASQDELINGGVPTFVEAMLGEGKDLTLKTYPRTKHGFFNDTRSDVYDGDAAEQAWDITRWFLERTL